MRCNMAVTLFTPAIKQGMVDAVPFWWHSIDLGDDVVTPGHSRPSCERVMARKIAPYLGNKSVLDVGCWDGKFSFQAEAMGASKVVGIDSGQQVEFVKSRYGMDINPVAGAYTARRILGSNVEFGQTEFVDYAEATTDKFDVTLFLGVLYHQQDPHAALRALRNITKEVAILETAVVTNPLRKTGYNYYPGAELNNDPTNWYVPTVGTLMDWIQEAGFRDVNYLGRHWLGRRAMVAATR